MTRRAGRRSAWKEADMTKTRKSRTKKHRPTNPVTLRRAVKWYIAGDGTRSLRDAVQRYAVPFEAVRKAAKASRRGRR
jgi:hypothetical protein